jgi:hypothetical protein
MAGDDGGRGVPRLRTPGDLVDVVEQILEQSGHWLK